MQQTRLHAVEKDNVMEIYVRKILGIIKFVYTFRCDIFYVTAISNNKIGQHKDALILMLDVIEG